MPDNPYPQWQRNLCVHCAAGEVLVGHSHWIGTEGDIELCTAPTEAEYIEDLEATQSTLQGTRRSLMAENDRLFGQIAELKAENARLRAAVLNQCGDNLCHLTEQDIADLKLNPARIPPRDQFIQSCERFYEQMSGWTIDSEPSCMTIAQLEAEVERLREAAAYCYQYAGATGADVKVLDNLSALAQGEKPPHEWPHPARSERMETLEQAARSFCNLMESGCVAGHDHPRAICNCIGCQCWRLHDKLKAMK